MFVFCPGCLDEVLTKCIFVTRLSASPHNAKADEVASLQKEMNCY